MSDRFNRVRRKEVDRLIRSRVNALSTSKVSGWGAKARSLSANEFVDNYFSTNEHYPTDEEILQIDAMAPSDIERVEDEIKKLINKLETFDGEIFVPLSPEFGGKYTKQDQPILDAVIELCRRSENFAAHPITFYPFNGILKYGDLFFERSLVELHDADDNKSYEHYLKRVAEIDAFKLRKNWKIEENILNELMSENPSEDAIEQNLKELDKDHPSPFALIPAPIDDNEK